MLEISTDYFFIIFFLKFPSKGKLVNVLSPEHTPWSYVTSSVILKEKTIEAKS